MSNCTITLHSTIEGKQTSSQARGTLTTDDDGAEVCYTDGGSEVSIVVTPSRVLITRAGDYGLSLPLENGKITKGSIGISGALGEITIDCEKLEYSIKKHALLLIAQYDLVFGEERQSTGIRVYAKGDAV